MLHDLRYGIRVLLRAPGFTATAVTALTLGIGATTAIFSVVHSVLLRPLPFREPRQLVALWERNRQDRAFVSPANFQDWKEQARSFTGMAAVLDTELNLTGGDGEPEELQAERVSAELFQLLGVRAAAGRVFRPGEDRDHVALLSDRLWKRRFGGNSAPSGAAVQFNGQSWTVVGILPSSFQLINRDVDVWVPLPLQPADTYRATGTRSLTVLARLGPGVSLAQAGAEMDGIAARLGQAWPHLNAGWGAGVVPLEDELVGPVRHGLFVLLAAVAFLLLIACANVANLLLACAPARQREIALRAAMGASRWHIVRQLGCESLLLAAAGGAFGLALGWAGIRLLGVMAPLDIPRMDGLGLNAAVLAFAVAASLATGVLFGLAPALALSRSNLAATLKESGRGMSGGPLRAQARNILVGIEVAAAAVLLTGAGLVSQSFLRLHSVDPGLRPDNLLTMRVLLPQRAASPERRVAFFREALERIRKLDGVRAAGAVNFLPLTGVGAGATFAVEGRPVPEISQRPTALVRAVDPEYFHAAGIPLLRGRAFAPQDDADAPKTIVISHSLARRFWPAPEAALGARIAIDSRQPYSAEVVGVVGDVYAEGMHDQPRPTIYCPHPQLPSTWMSLVVRTSSDPAGLVPAVTREIHALQPDLPVADVRTMEQVLAGSLANPRFDTLLLAAFAALALTLACVGVYGVVACHVAERTHEIGIRMALGAGRADVLRLVVGRGAVLAMGGAGAGMTAAFVLTRTLSGMLYGIGATDAATFAAVPLLLAGIAILASYIPALRAASVDPAIALRRE